MLSSPAIFYHAFIVKVLRIYSATKHEEKTDITITIHMWSGFLNNSNTPHIT